MTPIADRSPPLSPAEQELALRSGRFEPPRRRWPGVLAAAVLGAGLAALAISSWYDHRSLGTRLDAGVAAAQTGVQDQVAALRSAADDAAKGTAQAGGRVAEVLSDAGITAAVKTALAADPSLSAIKIDVSTHEGVVRLDGPAPDQKARDRAQVLAAAPQGVVGVENRLVVSAEAR